MAGLADANFLVSGASAAVAARRRRRTVCWSISRIMWAIAQPTGNAHRFRRCPGTPWLQRRRGRVGACPSKRRTDMASPHWWCRETRFFGRPDRSEFGLTAHQFGSWHCRQRPDRSNAS